MSTSWLAVDNSIDVSPSAIFIDGDWIVSDTNVTENKVIILNGNLTITSTGSLTFNNVTLKINQTANKMCRINVANGGEFYVNKESNITSNNSYYYLFTVYGKHQLNNSEVSMTHAFPGSWGGIHVFSDDVYIGNSTIFQYIGAGVTIESKTSTIYNTTFSDGFRGIWLWKWSNATVERCNFKNIGDSGIDVSLYSSLYVGNSTFGNITSSGVQSYYYTNTTIFNCTFNTTGLCFAVSALSMTTLNLLNSTIQGDGVIGVDEWSSCNVTIENTRITGVDEGVRVDQESNATIINSTFDTGVGFCSSYGSNVTLLNSTINSIGAELIVTYGSWIFVKWFLHVKVIDLNDNPIPNANVKVNDGFNNLGVDGYTGIDGGRSWIIVTNRSLNHSNAPTEPTTITYYTPHNITAEYNSVTNSTEVTMDVSKEVIIKLDIEVDPWVLPLSEGWNLISLPLIQPDESLDKVLASIEGKWDCIQVYNSTDPMNHWRTYRTFVPEQLNDLHSLNHKMGFWIHITEPNANLTLYGGAPTSTIIPFYAGWNLVGYPTLNDTETVANALWGTGADRVEVFDPVAPYRIREVGPEYVMKPGEGYWIHVAADSIWTIDW